MRLYLSNFFLALKKKHLIAYLVGIAGSVFMYAVGNIGFNWDIDLLFAAIIFSLLLWVILIVAEAAYQSAFVVVTRSHLAEVETLQAREATLTAVQKIKVSFIALVTVMPVVVIALALALFVAGLLSELGIIYQ